MKSANGALVPVDDDGRNLLARIPAGSELWADVTRARNLRFHRKFMAMLRFGFEHWEPRVEGYPDVILSKNFEHFRSQVMIMAGFFDHVVDLKGNLCMVARSVSFAKMTEDEFENVYRGCLEVLWKNIFCGGRYKSREELESVLSQLIQYD